MNKVRITDKKLRERLEAVPVRTGEAWTHRNGRNYLVISVGLREVDLTPEVIYAPEHGGPTFIRPLPEFLDRFRKTESVQTLAPDMEKAILDITDEDANDGDFDEAWHRLVALGTKLREIRSTT